MDVGLMRLAFALFDLPSDFRVYLYWGHVISWKNDHGEELLFVSSKAIFKPSKVIRGGIPICFPQFSNVGTLEQHGSARNREDPKIWLHRFEFRLRVALEPGGDLMITSHIRNTDEKPFSFTFAYHTYFSVSDIREVRVEGPESLDYLNNLQNRAVRNKGMQLLLKEVDKIYLSTLTKIAIIDHEKKRTFVIRKDGRLDAAEIKHFVL